MMAAPVAAQTAAVHVSVEGGLACSRNKSVVADDFLKLGDRGCGGTGAVEIGKTGAPVFSIFDHWAVRGRYTTFDDAKTLVDGTDRVDVSFKDRRIVLDAEVGAKVPFGLFGGTTRATVGIRYANWQGDFHAVATAGAALGMTEAVRLETAGIGPRIGLRSSIPLGTHWMYESRFGLAALFSRHDEVTGTFAAGRESNVVYSIDSSSALSYKLTGSDAGPVASVGVYSEYWFNQIQLQDGADEYKRNRHSWGPFARVRVPLQ